MHTQEEEEVNTVSTNAQHGVPTYVGGLAYYKSACSIFIAFT